ncbi:hypothetical protein WISP_139010 [Willisornis vidua]|uniref:Mitochondrial S-adenosylmethionine carrier protein n=1 Tax=Willisornis vidua TaxID=1566151 RepID=A0ABQ9CMM3_9PASS|nr:hypothetical protein WISP_139010 [Willisornis vidua]
MELERSLELKSDEKQLRELEGLSLEKRRLKGDIVVLCNSLAGGCSQIPFSLVQFPLWESLKISDINQKGEGNCYGVSDFRTDNVILYRAVKLVGMGIALEKSGYPLQPSAGGAQCEQDLWSWKQGHVVDSWQSAVCGAFAGGFAAAVTTPLDVAKTRIMLAKAGSRTASGNVLTALGDIWRTQGLSGLFAGVVPRMAAISLGGFIFLGTYEKTRQLLI